MCSFSFQLSEFPSTDPSLLQVAMKTQLVLLLVLLAYFLASSCGFRLASKPTDPIPRQDEGEETESESVTEAGVPKETTTQGHLIGTVDSCKNYAFLI